MSFPRAFVGFSGMLARTFSLVLELRAGLACAVRHLDFDNWDFTQER